MKTLIGGAIAVVLGIIGIAAWFKYFLAILAGAIPTILLLGGALALYLGFDELKDTWKKEEPLPPSADTEQNVESYKRFGQIGFSVPIVMFQMVAVILESIEAFVFDLPPRSCSGYQLLNILLGDLDVADP